MSKLILVVDDSASTRRVINIVLTGAGYEVIDACDGKDALEQLEKLDKQKVHLIISDVNMPVMDGIEFLKTIKHMPAHKFTPVIMLTTESSEEQKRAGQSAGARAWVVKPFRPEQFLMAVQRLCLP
jgi:two-component system chemotaxis response regulator CheY